MSTWWDWESSRKPVLPTGRVHSVVTGLDPESSAEQYLYRPLESRHAPATGEGLDLVMTHGESDASWSRLGELLTKRREELGLTRLALALRVGGSDRPIADIEHGRRTNFRSLTLAGFERAYELAPGAIQHALSGGDLITDSGDESEEVPPEYTHPEDVALWKLTAVPADRRRRLIARNQRYRDEEGQDKGQCVG